MGDLFDTKLWVYGKNKEWESRFQTYSKGRIPVISGITSNNGVNYYTEDTYNDEEIFCDSLTISTRGEYSGTVTYHQGKFLLANNILVMLMPNLSKKQKIFIGTLIEKLNYGGYNNYPKISTLTEDTICLPIKNNEIDFDFMESFISELEAYHISELEAYLQATGLSDYALTLEEKEAIDRYESIQWDSFNLLKLFGKSTRGKRLKSDDRIQGDLPFVTAGEKDEGVSDLIGNNVEIFEANTITIDMFGSAKYRSYKYGADDHIAVVHTDHLPKEAVVFVTSAIHKSSHNGQFNYGRNFYAKDADELNIMLPIKPNSQNPDFSYMQTFISAVQKLVIKDVVLYANKKIEITKQVSGQEMVR